MGLGAHMEYASGANKLKNDEKELGFSNNEGSHQHLDKIVTNQIGIHDKDYACTYNTQARGSKRNEWLSHRRGRE